MEIQIINTPKKLTILGDPEVLIEGSENEKENLDTVQESSIVYPDLVFTLKHNPAEYFRPVVKNENGQLIVVSNKLFYRASKEAGTKKIQFDLILSRGIPLEKLLEDNHLEFAPGAQGRNYLDRFLFFRKSIGESSSNNSKVIMHPENDSQEYLDNHCIRYSLLLYDNPEQAKSIETEFVARMFNENGYLRSISGLRLKSRNFGKYLE